MQEIFQVAAQISTPLTLGGFFAAVVFFIFRQILKKDIFPSLTKNASAEVIKVIVDRLFLLALIAMTLGFAGYVLPNPSIMEEKKNDSISYEPISHLEERLSALSLPHDEPVMQLHFISDRWDIDRYLTVSKRLSFGDLSALLLTQLQIKEHTKIEPRPLGKGCFTFDKWILTVNGKEFPEDLTLKAAELRDSSVIQFRVKSEIVCAAG